MKHLAGVEIVEFGNLIFAGVEVVVEILGVIEVLKGVAVLKADDYPRFGFGRIMASGIESEHNFLVFGIRFSVFGGLTA